MRVKEKIRLHKNKAFVEPRVQGSQEHAYALECLLDTGCNLPLVVSEEDAAHIQRLSNVCCQEIRFADGTGKDTKVFAGKIYWRSTKPKRIAVTVMNPCPCPLLGLPLLKQSKIVLRQQSGYVKSLLWPGWPNQR